jgi:3'-5' exoribonuclease
MVRDAAADQKIPAASIQELLHIILSHHGEREKGSPMECVTKEAFIVHYADELDAVMNQFDTAEAKGSWSFDYMLKRDLFLKK